MFGFVVFTLCSLSTVALRLEDADEGDCRGTQFKPFSTTELDVVDRFRYISGGNRYDQYVFAYGHPRFAQMSERELRDNMCLTHNSTDATGRGNAIGFGGLVLGTYQFTAKDNLANVFDFEYYPRNSANVPLVRGTETITLTDYENFAFIASCYTVGSSDHKVWEVVTLTPSISPATRQIIENHAVSLGFHRKNFLFQTYKNCEAGTSGNDGGSIRGQTFYRNGASRRGLGSVSWARFSGQLGWK